MPIMFLSLIIAGVILAIVLVVAVVFRKAIGGAFIVVAEIFILVANVIFVLACGFSGSKAAVNYAIIAGIPRENAGVFGFIVSAALAFLVSSLISAVFFLLIRIENNTRRVAGYFDRMTGAQNNP
jgi:hypothetical protein